MASSIAALLLLMGASMYQHGVHVEVGMAWSSRVVASVEEGFTFSAASIKPTDSIDIAQGLRVYPQRERTGPWFLEMGMYQSITPLSLAEPQSGVYAGAGLIHRASGTRLHLSYFSPPRDRLIAWISLGFDVVANGEQKSNETKRVRLEDGVSVHEDTSYDQVMFYPPGE